MNAGHAGACSCWEEEEAALNNTHNTDAESLLSKVYGNPGTRAKM